MRTRALARGAQRMIKGQARRVRRPNLRSRARCALFTTPGSTIEHAKLLVRSNFFRVARIKLKPLDPASFRSVPPFENSCERVSQSFRRDITRQRHVRLPSFGPVIHGCRIRRQCVEHFFMELENLSSHVWSYKHWRDRFPRKDCDTIE